MNRDGLFWGLGLVLLGGLLLVDNLGLLPGVNVWSIFWPLVLVFFGVRILLRSTRSRIIYSDGSASSPVQPVGTAERGMDAAPAAGRAGDAVRLPLQSVRQATVRIHHGAGELRLDSSAAPDELLSGTFVGGLEQQLSGGPEAVTLDLRVPAGSMPMMDFGAGRGLDWTFGLNPNIPLALDLEVGASRSILNLNDLQVKDLRLQTGASATEIALPARAGEVRAVIRSGAAAVTVRVPDNVSARIRTHGGLSSFDIDTQRFPQTGISGEYASPDFLVAANRIDLDIETGLGSASVR